MASSSELRLRGIFGTGFVKFKWQDDGDTEDEVLDTMRMAVVDLDEIKQVLETKITEYKAETKSYANMKTLCANFNKITDTLITLWRGTHKLQELQTFPTLSFLEHIMRRCYKNSLTNSSASELKEFNKNLFETTDAIFKHLRMNEDDVFIDINCGNGSVVLQMAASGSFKYCYGVSSPDETNYVPETMLTEFTKWMGFYGKDYTEFQFFREEFMSSEMLKLVSESTIIFLKDTDTEPAMKNQISQLFSQLKEETRVVSLKNCEQFFGSSSDKSVDVEDFEGKQYGTRFFVHTVRLKKRSTEQEINTLPAVSTATAAAPKRRNSAGHKKNNFQAKQASKQEIVDEVREPAPTIDSLHASLEKILSCYRAQFIKFVDFMQSPEYRQQLEGAVKKELLRKSELEEKLQSLMLQINELNGSSVTLAKRPKNGISDEVNYHSDLLAEAQSLLNQNKELQQQELKLNDEIGQLERIEIVKQCHDQISNLRNKEDDLSTMNRQYLVSKASEWYQNYIYLSAKVKSLETEVAALEGTKQTVSLADRQKSIEHFLKSFCKKSSESGVEKQTQPSTASLLKQDVQLSGSLLSLSSQRETSDGIAFEGNLVDKSRLFEKFCGSAYAPACRASVTTDHLVRKCTTSSDQTGCFSPTTVGSARHISDPKYSTTIVSSSAQTQKHRHWSSSSTDTADSEQGLSLNTDGDFRGNTRPASGSPVSAQNDVLKLLTSISKPENFFHSVSGLKQPLPVSEALRVLASYTSYADQTRSSAARNLAVTKPEVISSGGRGKPAVGKRGKRKRTAFTPSHSDSSVSDRSVDAGNLDALFLAVSLHHLSPRHRDPSHESTEAQKSNFFESCHVSSVSSLQQRQANNLTVAMATGQSSLTVPSWSLLHGAEFRTPSTPFSLATNAPRQENKLPPEAGVDDSHGKHFKKRLHSSNFKLDHDQKGSSKTLPSVSSTETTAPILKYLFTKQETSPAIPKGSSAFHPDSTSVRHTNESLLTASSSSSTLLPPPKSQADQITAINKSFKGSNLPPQTSAAGTQYLNAWPDALKLRGASWYSLSMSSLLKYSLPQNSSQSNVFGTAHAMVPGAVTSFALLNPSTTISTKAQMNTLSTSQTSISKDQHLVTTAVSQTTSSQKNGSDA